MRRLLIPAALFLSACDAPVDDGVEVWRFAIEESPGSVQDAYAQRFAEAIASRTDGAVDVKVYPYGSLGTSDHVTELLHNGTLQLATASPGHLGKLIPEVQVFLLHFLLSDSARANARALQDPELLAAFQPLYREKGFDLLTLFSEGQMVWTLQEPVERPEDFAGVKMRTMTSPLLLAAYEAYGASPTPLPYSEVYSALQLSMIDGQVNPIFAIQEMSFHEVTEVMVRADHLPFVTSVAAHTPFLEALSPERRALVDDVIADLQPWIAKTQVRYNDERLDLIRERRPDLQLLRLDDDARAAFAEAAEPVRERFVDDVGQRGMEVLQVVEAAVERAEDQERGRRRKRRR